MSFTDLLLTPTQTVLMLFIAFSATILANEHNVQMLLWDSVKSFPTSRSLCIGSRWCLILLFNHSRRRWWWCDRPDKEVKSDLEEKTTVAIGQMGACGRKLCLRASRNWFVVNPLPFFHEPPPLKDCPGQFYLPAPGCFINYTTIWTDIDSPFQEVLINTSEWICK